VRQNPIDRSSEEIELENRITVLDKGGTIQSPIQRWHDRNRLWFPPVTRHNISKLHPWPTRGRLGYMPS